MKDFINFLEYVFNRTKKCCRMESVSKNAHQKGPHCRIASAGHYHFELLTTLLFGQPRHLCAKQPHRCHGLEVIDIIDCLPALGQKSKI